MDKKEKNKKDDYEKMLSNYSKAMKSFHKGDYEKAAELLLDFLDKHPDEKEFVDRAQIYIEICKGREVKEKIPLKTFDDYYQYSVYKINQGKYEEALKLLEKARDMNPKEGKVFYLMADAYCLKNDKERCLEHLKKAIQLDEYFRILAENEIDFEPLKEDKKFKLIIRMT
jgi:tetratricopeptide (TPR) repeat protein